MERSTVVVEVSRFVFGALYVVGGGVHLVFWRRNPGIYSEITPYVRFDWYRSIWSGVVIPNLDFLLPLLSMFEFFLAVIVLNRGKVARIGNGVGSAFQVALAPLGYWWPANIVLAAGHVVLARCNYPRSFVAQARRIRGGNR